jgi:hypothetical protein
LFRWQERQHQVGRREGAVDRGPGGLVGAGPDRRHGVHGVLADLGPDGCGPPRRPAGRGLRQREHVGHDVGLAGIDVMAGGEPVVMGPAEEGQVLGGVHGEQRRVAVVGGRVHGRPRGADGVQQRVAPLGGLVGGQLDTQPDATTHVVEAVALVPDHGHGQRGVTISGHAPSRP